MARLLTCPHGHQWQPPADGPDHSPDTAVHCPVCGAGIARAPGIAADPGGRAGSETVLLRPPPAGSTGDRIVVPGYEVLGELGRGGMGVVYRARHVRLNRLVALKMVLAGAHAGPEQLARFRAEAEAVARLQHPNIVQIYEVGEHQGLPYCALEFCPGGSLTARLNGTPLPPAPAAQVAETLARAVHAAHEAGVVHRDLKPANVLLVPSDRPEAVALDGGAAPGKRFEPKVTDFGLAKRLGSDSTGPTESGAVLGTPSYMAPEQAAGQGKAVGPTADVYALGAVLYELLTGRPPFRAAIPLVTLAQVLSDEPVPPARLNAGVPRDLETICLKCLAKAPDRRYASALDLADDLARFRRGEPVRARPVGRLERAGRWARRHPGVAVALAAVLLALAAGTAVSTAFAVRLGRANADLVAEQDRTRAALAAEKRRRQQARQALDAMSSQVIDDWLASRKELTPAQKQFLQGALALYEEFARDTGQDEPARAAVAAAYLRVGNIRTRLGQLKEAEAAFRASQEDYARLADDFPAVADYRSSQAAGHNGLGALFQDTGQAKEAEAEYRAALGLFQRLADDFPAVPDYREGLAAGHYNLGNLLRNTGRGWEAEAEYRQALDSYQRLADDAPTVPSYREELAQSHVNLGLLLTDAGRAEEAEAEYRQALALLRRLAGDFPTIPTYRQNLATCHCDRGRLLANVGRVREAEGEYRKALALQQALADGSPVVPRYRQELAASHGGLGNLLQGTGRAAEAEVEYRKALTLFRRLADDFPAVSDYQNAVAGTLVNLAVHRDQSGDYAGARRLLEEALPYHRAALKANPRHPGYRTYFRNNSQVLADTLLHLGDHAAVAVAAARLAEAAVDPPSDLYNAACFLARCAPLAGKDDKLPEAKRQELAKEYGDRAMAVLRQAVAKGFKDAAQMKKDPDLDPLRRRDDFRRLLADLETPKPGSR